MFDIQIFGANDTLTSSDELKLNLRFTDEDTRTISLPNPKNNLTASDIQSTSSVLLATQAFIGDKAGAPFATIVSAQRWEVERRKLDLS